MSGKALVTGGAGFIGSHLVEALVEQGVDTVVLDDLSSGRIENLADCIERIEFLRGSILDEHLLRRAIQGCDRVFHLAAVVSVQKSIEVPLEVHHVNATGTLAVLEASADIGAKVVLSSSAAVYGDLGDQAAQEGMAADPISHYGVQKLAGEMYARALHRTQGLRAVSLRYFNVYGPRQDPSSPYSGVISIFSNLARQGATLQVHGDGLQTRDFVFVQDVVRANLLAMEGDVGSGEAINVGTGSATTIASLAALLANLAGRGSTVEHSEGRRGDIRFSCSDPALASRLLGFRAETPLATGLEKTLDWAADSR